MPATSPSARLVPQQIAVLHGKLGGDEATHPVQHRRRSGSAEAMRSAGGIAEDGRAVEDEQPPVHRPERSLPVQHAEVVELAISTQGAS